MHCLLSRTPGCDDCLSVCFGLGFACWVLVLFLSCLVVFCVTFLAGFGGGGPFSVYSHTWLRSSPHLHLINPAVFKEQPNIQSPLYCCEVLCMLLLSSQLLNFVTCFCLPELFASCLLLPTTNCVSLSQESSLEISPGKLNPRTPLSKPVSPPHSGSSPTSGPPLLPTCTHFA